MDLDRAADEVLGAVLLGGDDEQVATRDRQDALRADRRRHELGEDRLRGVAHVVDRDVVAALRPDEGVGRAVVGGHGDALGLGALLAGPVLLRVLTVAVGEVLEARARVPRHVAGNGVEDGPAAGAALPVALVGRRDVLVVDPCDGVGLAGRGRGGSVEAQVPVLLVIDARESHRAGGEVVADLAGLGVEDDHRVVLLQGERDPAAVGRDLHVLRLEVLRGVDARQAGEVDVLDSEVGDVLRQVDHRQVPRRLLGQTAVAGFLVTLVLHRDEGAPAPLRHVDGVGLAAEVEPTELLARLRVEDDDDARGVGEALGGVDDDEQPVVVGGEDARGLTRDLDEAIGSRVLRVADVDEADALGRGVGVDDGVAVGGDGRDLGDRLLVLRRVGVGRDRGQPVEGPWPSARSPPGCGVGAAVEDGSITMVRVAESPSARRLVRRGVGTGRRTPCAPGGHVAWWGRPGGARVNDRAAQCRRSSSWIWRAIGAAVAPPVPPCETETATT